MNDHNNERELKKAENYKILKKVSGIILDLFSKNLNSEILTNLLVNKKRDLIFIPERNHIVSVSWDRTIKVWKGYRKVNLYHKKNEKDSEKKFETWVWDQMYKNYFNFN
jgi:5-formaminoimidazole-4-carboxamide-1-beta-D-ribofuranosyl 5'-monophosphate synthetase